MTAFVIAYCACSAANAADVRSLMRVRIAWGGGQPAIWKGHVQLKNGSLDGLENLSIHPQSPGSIFLDGKSIQIGLPMSSHREVLDVDLVGQLDDVLEIQLVANGKQLNPLTVPLRDLVKQVVQRDLDDQGRSILLSRVPGDQLRVTLDREHLVFTPGDTWNLQVQPHLTGLEDVKRCRFEAQLRAGPTSRPVWKTSQDLEFLEGRNVEGRDGIEPVVLPIQIPEEEGVYQLDLRVSSSLLRNPFGGKPDELQRSIQLAVVDSCPGEPDPVQTWSSLLEFDPTQDRWWERLRRLPTWNPLVGSSGAEIGNQLAFAVEHGSRRLTRLDARGWQGYALPVEKIGRPHLLEIEYPLDVAQTLAVSVMQPVSEMGDDPHGPDTCMRIGNVPVPKGEFRWLRMVYWPVTENPYVLVANMGNDPVAFGRIRVSAGIDRLAASSQPADVAGRRLSLAHIDTPAFVDALSAPRPLDEVTGRPLEDWNTFYEAGDRLVQFLRHAGYAGAVVNAYQDGGTIYPSDRLAANLRFDQGRLSGRGQDPVQKDVLELLFRWFDREQLVLMPALDFSSSLPALERLIREASADDGPVLVHVTGKTTVSGATNPTPYNPLDKRVQQAVRDVIQELTTRYGHHPSFGGISLRLGARSFLQLPNEQWAYDAGTIDEFMASLRATKIPHQINRPSDLLQSPLRDAWLTWRAARMADFFGSLRDQVAGSVPGAKLLLPICDWDTSSPLHLVSRPSLSRRMQPADVFFRMGLDINRFNNPNQAMLLRPHRFDALANRDEGTTGLNTDATVDQLFSERVQRGANYYHSTDSFELKDLAGQKPFDLPGADTRINPMCQFASHVNRRRFIHTMATMDPEVLVDGGNGVPLGQFDTLIRFLDSYNQLPTDRFHTVELPDQNTDPLTLRILRKDGLTYFYLLNDSPWAVSSRVRIKSTAQCQLSPLSETCPLPALERDGDFASWSQDIAPYSMVVGKLSDQSVEIVDFAAELSDAVLASLRERLAAVVARAATLADPPALRVLSNPGFEAFAGALQTPGWELDGASEQDNGVDTTHYFTGRASLKLSSSGQLATAISDGFVVPKTGRITLQVQMQTSSDKPLPVDLFIQGQVEEQTIDRRLRVEVAPRHQSAEEPWSLYELPVDDLPINADGELRVGFQLTGPGTVWIDDVRVHDIWFSRAEQNELSKILALADLQLRDGQAGDCLRTLQRYWPNFLLEHVPVHLPQIADVQPAQRKPTSTATPQPRKSPPELFERVRQFLPKIFR